MTPHADCPYAGQARGCPEVRRCERRKTCPAVAARDRVATTRTPFTVVEHHWRNPMAVIAGNAATLASRWDELSDAQRRSLVEAIATRADELTGWIERVLFAMTPA